MSRKRRPGNVDPLAAPMGGGLSLEEFARAGYGDSGGIDLSMIDDPRVIAEQVSIFEIHPDQTQPRRAVPSAVRERFDYGPDTLGAIFEHWLDEVQRERSDLRREPFDALAYIGAATPSAEVTGDYSSDETVEVIARGPLEVGPLEVALVAVLDLAVSIRRDGLANPITVVEDGSRYLIETGERRWLAFHLLHWLKTVQGDLPGLAVQRQENGDRKLPEDWGQIPAHIVKKRNPWRQAAENTARANLNAIGRARQFALLLMDVLGPERFRPFSEFGPQQEQSFYSQVADAEKFKVPRGQADRLLTAMGMEHRNAFMRCRKILALPAEIWRKGDDENWPEDRLLKSVTSRDRPPATVQHHEDLPRWAIQVERVRREFKGGLWFNMDPDSRRAAYEAVQSILADMQEMGFDH